MFRSAILLSLVALAFGQGQDQNTLVSLIHQEVVQIMTAQSTLTVNACTSKCDALFDLAAGNDERYTDYICRRECTRYSQTQQRPDHDLDDPLNNLIHAEVQEILNGNAGISVEHCSTKCDALFDLDAGHDEEMVDKLCMDECRHQIGSTSN